MEIRHSLSQVRLSVFGQDLGQEITPIVAFAGAMPEDFLKISKKWLNSGSDACAGTCSSPCRGAKTPQSHSTGSFLDIIEFWRCDLIIRVLGLSATELLCCNVPKDTVYRFTSVRKTMTRADRIKFKIQSSQRVPRSEQGRAPAPS